jgi:hypothetical protein
MEVILVVFNDVNQSELIGVMIFKSFSDLMRKTDNFFIYADAKKNTVRPQKKVSLELLLKSKNIKIYFKIIYI